MSHGVGRALAAIVMASGLVVVGGLGLVACRQDSNVLQDGAAAPTEERPLAWTPVDLGFQGTRLVSLDSDGSLGDAASGGSAISLDGRYVVFDSDAHNLVPEDTNGVVDVFVRDLVDGTTERVSVGQDGKQLSFHSYGGSISADGRFVTFKSATALLPGGGTKGQQDIYVRDRVEGTVERVSVNSSGEVADASSPGASISADGRYVAFDSAASNLVADNGDARSGIFIRDLVAKTTRRLDLESKGAAMQGLTPHEPSISGHGRFVAFTVTLPRSPGSDVALLTTADELVRANGAVMVWDTHEDTIRFSTLDTPNGARAAAFSLAISGDGRFVAFNDRKGLWTADVGDGSAERISGHGVMDAALSYDGRFVAYMSREGGTMGAFVWDREDGSVTEAAAGGAYPSISGDGRYVMFTSDSANLVPGDTNGRGDVFVRAMW